MANWVVGPFMEKFMEKIIEIFSNYAQDQFKWQTGMKEELKRLRENRPKIEAVVSTARQLHSIDQNSPLNKWIWQLRDAIDEADDLLDDLVYKEHQQYGYLQNLIEVGKRALKIDPELMRLVEATHKLDDISAGVSDFLHLLEGQKQEQREKEVESRINREEASFVENDMIGRDKEKEFVLKWLSNSSDETTAGLYRNISVLSIVGHGGMGKTTLLQHVYQNEITKEFPLKMWVSVSDSFDVKKVIADMLESLENKRPSSVETLDGLIRNLMSQVKFKKFLLVLDDLWDKEEESVLFKKWEKVFSGLSCGGLGSKILITTRTNSVASMIANVIKKEKEALKLEGLKEDECFQLLTTSAFLVEKNPDDHKKLKFIARGLVKNLYGCPLVAKVVGGVLSSNLDERYWIIVLINCLAQNDISSTIKLSYIFLPEHLKSCFSFCSIFPQDHLFNKNDLVQMWIAVGFIQQSHIQGETLEDIGERYFDVLIKKSFFDIFGDTRKYKMHDLLHELAQSVSIQECSRFVGDKDSLLLEIPETIRHLSVETSNLEVLKKLERFKNLRTLRITDNGDRHSCLFYANFQEIFQATRSIRLLQLISFNSNKIPEEIKYLHHLRYLRRDCSDIKLLPSSLSSLYHLQFIILNDRYWLNPIDIFPKDMNNLCNLRYLRYPSLTFPGIGKLKFLQQLNEFCIMNEIGYGIDELEHMNELRILKLTNLEAVSDDQKGLNAKLCDKKKLMHLSLQWDIGKGTGIFWEDSKGRNITDPDLDERVLNNLQPHNCLKTLTIINYMGARSATWMNEANLLNNLEAIYLDKCFEWEILPPFGLLPFLKALSLENMPKAKWLENKFDGRDMCCVFPSLQWLSFRNLESLVDWFDTSVVDGLFPCLTVLSLSDCPNLQELPCMPHKLETLNIHNIGWKTLNCKKSIPLKSLYVDHCPNITSISLPDEIGKLERLAIEDCPSLQSLSSLTSISSIDKISFRNLEALVDWFDTTVVDGLFPCLIELFLSDCPNLQELPCMPHKLERLKIHNIGWKTLNCKKSIPLKTLEVHHCPNITSISLPHEIGKLERLSIKDCQSLQTLSSSANIYLIYTIYLESLPQLRELPDGALSEANIYINGCNPEIMKRYHQF